MDLDQIVLIDEDFAEMSLGTTSEWPITAEGEYHVVDRTIGQWTEAQLFGGPWRAGTTPIWKVLEADGRHVMAMTNRISKGTPMLIAGERFWDDYAIEAEFQYNSHEGACGLVLRYQNSRCYTAVQIHRGHIALVQHRNGSRRWLASRGYLFDVDCYYTVSAECRGAQITVKVNGETLLQGQEPDYRQGKVGFWAEAPARFAVVRVTTSNEAAARSRQRSQEWIAEEEALRQRLPKPVLWKKIPTPGFGTDRNLRFGDLDGDGELEIVLTQRVNLTSGDFPAISCITAIDLDGNVLWQHGEPLPYTVPATSDNCFQVYDLNGDGRDEVLFCKDFQIFMADGQTGEILQSAPTPFALRKAAGARPYARILGDSLFICNLSGGPRPQEILIKDRYTDIWALDHNFNQLWHHETITGHFPAAYDIDGDGHDEILAGYMMLDHDGSVLWELPIEDHQDAISFSRPDPDRPDQIQIGLGAGDGGFVIATAQGEILQHYTNLGHAQSIAVANLRPDLPGLEYAMNTFWGNPGIISIFNCRGEMLHSFEPVTYASAMTLVNWAMDGQELLFLSGHPSEGGLLDAHGHRAVMLPDDGHPYHCCTSLDITGDGRDELVVWDADSIWIYKADAPLPEGRRYRPLRRPKNYNESNYMASVSEPNWE